MVICLLPLRPFHTANQLGSVRRARRTEVAMRGSATSTGIRRACTQVNFFSIFLNQRNLKMTAISNKPRWAARKVIIPNGKLSLSMDATKFRVFSKTLPEHQKGKTGCFATTAVSLVLLLSLPLPRLKRQKTMKISQKAKLLLYVKLNKRRYTSSKS